MSARCPWCGAAAVARAVNCGMAFDENRPSGVAAGCPDGCMGARAMVACDPLDEGAARLAQASALRRFGAWEGRR